MKRMTQYGWKEVNSPSGFANSNCGDIVIRILLFLMLTGVVALVIILLK
jgi:hypothetical protein